MLSYSQIESLLIEARCSSVSPGKARQPPEGKGTTAEGRSGCLPVWSWAVRKDRADCHKTLWSAIADDRRV